MNETRNILPPPVRKATKQMTEVEDNGTANLLTDILRDLDKQLWLLEAHVNNQQKTSK